VYSTSGFSFFESGSVLCVLIFVPSRFGNLEEMRRTESIAILAVLALSLLGCRADNTTKEAEPPDSAKSVPAAEASLPAQNPPATTNLATPIPASTINDRRPLIVCFGDSLTAGYGTEPGKSYPDYLQADLDAKKYQYRVVNEGISGNTTKDGVQRVDSIVAMKPAIVIVEFGGNDGLRGFRIEDSRANLDEIVGKLKAGGARIVLAGITLPPNYGPDYISQFNETYVLLSKKYNAPLLPFLLKDVYGVDGMMQADNTHATAEGNKIVAKNILPLVLPLLKK
jgi:acyl-CoA thioesterase-1